LIVILHGNTSNKLQNMVHTTMPGKPTTILGRISNKKIRPTLIIVASVSVTRQTKDVPVRATCYTVPPVSTLLLAALHTQQRLAAHRDPVRTGTST
jgi:hypothetical protein